MGKKKDFDVADAKARRERAKLKDPVVPAVSDSPAVPTSVRKAAVEREKRIREEVIEFRKNSFDEAVELHKIALIKLEMAMKALTDASRSVNALDSLLKKKPYYREIHLSRRLRLDELTRTVEVARERTTKVVSGSKSVNRFLLDNREELTRADLGPVFELPWSLICHDKKESWRCEQTSHADCSCR